MPLSVRFEVYVDQSPEKGATADPEGKHPPLKKLLWKVLATWVLFPLWSRRAPALIVTFQVSRYRKLLNFGG